MRPADVLDHKADLMDRLTSHDVYTAWRAQVALDIRWEQETSGVTRTVTPTPEQIQRNRSNAAAIITTLRHALPEAECFYVNEDMTTLVQYAATQLDETDRFQRMMLPTRSGIVRFEGGLPWTDARGKKMRLSWAVWGPILATGSRHDVGEPTEYTHFWLFNDHFDEPDQIAYELIAVAENLAAERGQKPGEGEAWARRIFGRWGFMGGEYLVEHQRLGPAMRQPDEIKMAEILADGDTPVAYTNPARLLHALWMLLGQTVTRTDEEHLDRPHRKRALKARIPARVTVVRLRNIETHRTEGESLVEWNHRWVVRGHPAWRACGPNHPLAEEYPGDPTRFRCRVWIAPFVKGPEDKPLIKNEKVYALVR